MGLAFRPVKCPETTDLAKSVKLGYNTRMESITKNVRDISLPDKLALEHVIGQQLVENQQVIIQICSLDLRSEPATTERNQLKDCLIGAMSMQDSPTKKSKPLSKSHCNELT